MTDFSNQFRKNIMRYKRIGYNLNVMRQSACLVIYPITVDGYAALFHCMLVDRRSVVSVSCFGVRVSMMFHFMFVHYILVQFGLLSGHLLGNSCLLGKQFVLIVFCLIVIFIYFPFWF